MQPPGSKHLVAFLKQKNPFLKTLMNIERQSDLFSNKESLFSKLDDPGKQSALFSKEKSLFSNLDVPGKKSALISNREKPFFKIR
jgi:hypothetical protein